MPTFFLLFLASFVSNAMFFANHKNSMAEPVVPGLLSTVPQQTNKQRPGKQTDGGDEGDGGDGEDGLIVMPKDTTVSGAAIIRTSSTGFTSGAVKRVTATLAVQALQ